MSLNISLIFVGLTIKPLFRNPFLIGPDRESHISDFSTHRHQISLWDTSIISWPQTSTADSSSTQPPLSESAKKWVPKNPTDGPLNKIVPLLTVKNKMMKTQGRSDLESFPIQYMAENFHTVIHHVYL